MITNNGKLFIKKYLANQAGQAAGAVSLGIGGAAPTSTDARMQFEFYRAPLTLLTYDFVNDRLVFKANLPENVYGIIYEVGIWTNEVNNLSNNQQSRIITSFDSATENWDVPTFDSSVTRIGADSLKHTPAASASSTSILQNAGLDLSNNTSQDLFNIAFNVDNANTASVKFRLRTDASNYFEFTISSPSTGYNIVALTKGSGTVVGAPAWEDINDIAIITTANSNGAASVEYDGLRIEDVDTFNIDYGLIARVIPATPVVKLEGQIFDVEYSLPVTM